MQEFKIISPTDFLRDSREDINKNFQCIATDFSGDTFPTQNLWPGMNCYRTDQKKLYFLYSTSEEVTGGTNNDWRLLIDFSEAGKAVVPYAENAEIAGKAKTDINGNTIHSNTVNRNTAYTVGAIVQHPDIPAGTFLRCTTAGTTAAAAPAFSPKAEVGTTYTDGGVTWTLDSYLPTSGGTMRGSILANSVAIKNYKRGSRIILYGGVSPEDSAALYLCDNDDSINPGQCIIALADADGAKKYLSVKPNGEFSWNRQQVVRSVDGINANTAGNVALNTMAYKKLSSIKSVKGCFWADSNSGIDIAQMPSDFDDSIDWYMWQIGMLNGNDKIQFASGRTTIWFRQDDASLGNETWTRSSWKQLITENNIGNFASSNWTISKGTNGWARDKTTGFTIQWGSHVNNKQDSDSSSPKYTVTFPLAFTSCYSVTGSPRRHSNNNYAYRTGHHILTRSTTNFVYSIGGEQQANAFDWIAIGVS